MWIISAGGIGYSTDGGATISNIGLTADGHIVADTINLNTANISGQLSASNIDATNLHVQSANIDGDITADAINLNTAHIDGTLSAQNIDVDSITVKNANIESLYASKIIGGSGTHGGYVSAGAISDAGNVLSNIYVRDAYMNNAVIYDHIQMSYMASGSVAKLVTISGNGVALGTDSPKSWADILAGTGSGGAVFG